MSLPAGEWNAEWNAARARTDVLFGLLNPAARYDRPVAERHRLIFYVGHLEAFDTNLIARGALGKPAFDASLDRLVAFGIRPEAGWLPSGTPGVWPAEEEGRRY